MAKVPFSKLGAKVCDASYKTFYCDTKGEKVFFEVKYYLPVEEKLELISNIINQSIDDNGYYNPIRLQIYTVLEVMYAYTNLSFTEKQKENPFKLYDQLVSTGIFQDVITKIYEQDWEEIQKATITIIENVYKYKNSLMGIIENVTSDFGALDLDAGAIQKTLADPENMTLLKDILTKLG